MTTWETPYNFSPLYLCSFDIQFSMSDYKASISTISDLTWTANLATLMPFQLNAPFLVRRFSLAVGASAANVDVGVYTAGGVLITSIGGVASNANSLPQYAAASTVTLLEPGSYFLGVACSGTTTTIFGGAAAAISLAGSGQVQASSSYPLPATVSISEPLLGWALTYPIAGMAQV